MSALIYVVTRITEARREGVVEIPNLGVHSSYAKAARHFKAVVKDRGAGRNISCMPELHPERMQVVLEFRTDLGENIRLEKWRVK